MFNARYTDGAKSPEMLGFTSRLEASPGMPLPRFSLPFLGNATPYPSPVSISMCNARKLRTTQPKDKLRCNCAILGIPDRQCSRHATVGTLCTQHAKMDKPGNRVFRWDWEDGKPC